MSDSKIPEQHFSLLSGINLGFLSWGELVWVFISWGGGGGASPEGLWPL